TPRRSLIAQRREQLGIGIAEIARRIGVSVSEYRDIELYEDELTMVLALNNARSLAAPAPDSRRKGPLSAAKPGSRQCFDCGTRQGRRAKPSNGNTPPTVPRQAAVNQI